jgi:hypothetical protein
VTYYLIQEYSKSVLGVCVALNVLKQLVTQDVYHSFLDLQRTMTKCTLFFTVKVAFVTFKKPLILPLCIHLIQFNNYKHARECLEQ